MADGGVGGTDTVGTGSDDGPEGDAAGSPPHATFVNATMSSVPVLVSFKSAPYRIPHFRNR
jgi:hypothetical protein